MRLELVAFKVESDVPELDEELEPGGIFELEGLALLVEGDDELLLLDS